MVTINQNYIHHLKSILGKTKGTQAELAQRLGVTFATLSRWIHGHAVPHKSHLVSINRLYREYVGLEAVPRKEYKVALQQANRLRKKDIAREIASHSGLEQELTVDSSFNSNSIEGTSLTFRETEALIVNHIQADRPFLDNLVVSNHAAIMRDILKGKYAAPLAERGIKEMHQRLFQGVREDAGEYSTFQRGVTGLNIHLTHPKDIPDEMKSFVKTTIHKPEKLHDVEWIARCHAQFELIHPFGDGNGRIGRLIILIQCLACDYPPIIIEEKRRAEYYEVLEQAQRYSEDHLVQFLVSEMVRTDRLMGKYGK